MTLLFCHEFGIHALKNDKKFGTGIMKIKFTKMQALGNDFVLFDCTILPVLLSSEQIKFIANRRLGIGCDQVLLLEPSNDSDVNYKIFNADGSSASHCGNGARSVIAYLWNKLNKPQITLKMQNQSITGYKNQDDTISINMGMPNFNPQSLPFNHQEQNNNEYHLDIDGTKINFGICSVGNPHVMIRLNSTHELDNNLEHIAKLLQNSLLFPNSVNVNFYVVINESQIKLLTYERGCGFTEACGTGATATACYAMDKNQVSTNVTVEMLGGKLNIQKDSINQIIMTGDAIHVFDGEICI